MSSELTSFHRFYYILTCLFILLSFSFMMLEKLNIKNKKERDTS